MPEKQGLLSLVIGTVLCFVATAPVHGQIVFEEVTSQAGLSYIGQTYGSAWGDFDADGCVDIFVSNHYDQAPSLYKNQCDGTFVDVAGRMIPDYHDKKFPGDFHGAAWADYDNDGDLDLLLSVGGNRGSRAKTPNNFNRLYENVGDSFVNRAEEKSLADPGARGRTPYWLDMTGDGHLDVLLNQKDPPTPSSLAFRQNDGGFIACPKALPGAVGKGWSNQFSTRVRLFAADTPVLIYGFGDTSKELFAQSEACRFEPSATDGFRLTGASRDFVVSDLDGDLRSDFFVATEKAGEQMYAGEMSLVSQMEINGGKGLKLDLSTGGTLRLDWFPDTLWRKDSVRIGKSGESFKTFKLPGKGRILELSSSDPKTNGLPDVGDSDPAISIGFLPGKDIWRITARSKKERTLYLKITSTEPLTVERIEPTPVKHLGTADHLLMDNDRGLSDRTKTFGLSEMLTTCRSVAAGDFDNDMDIDLYLVCGTSVGNLPNRVYENVAGQRFADVSQGSGAQGSPDGRGDHVSVGDYDNDGFIDLFVTNGFGPASLDGGPHQLFRNQGNENNWIKIDLVGTNSNRDAYGSRVFVAAGGVTQMRELTGGMRKGVQDSQLMHFGLGSNEKIDGVIVQWPSGEFERFGADDVNRLYQFKEGDSGNTSIKSEIALLSPRLEAASGSAQTFLAVHGENIDKASVRWRISEDAEAEGWFQRLASKFLGLAGNGPGSCETMAVCRHVFAAPGAYEVRVSASTVDGKEVSASLTVTVQ